MAELCRLWSQQLLGSRAFRGSSGSFGDRSRAGSVVPQLAEVAAASGLISFLLRLAAFLITVEGHGLGGAELLLELALESLSSPANNFVSTELPISLLNLLCL